jgi:mono/diheme cytochrome c family protein
MYTGLLHTHNLVVTIFLLIYLIKTVLLLLNKKESLAGFVRKTRVLEMTVSALFLLTGIYLAMNSGNIGPWFWYKIIAVALSIPIAVVAFKKQNKGLAFLSMFLIIYSYGVSEVKAPFFKKDKPEILASGDAMAVGQDVYTKLCVNCHGDNGKMGLSGAKDLTISALTREEKINLVMNGKNGMAAYKKTLSEEQVNDVVDFVETLKNN